jgi:hypothetical protein
MPALGVNLSRCRVTAADASDSKIEDFPGNALCNLGVVPKMSFPTWVFARGDDRFTIVRVGARALLYGPTQERADFLSADALREFQGTLERSLTALGWEYVGFHPERRRSPRHRARVLTFRSAADE